MDLTVSPADSPELPAHEYLLEEFKHVAAEVQFVMTKYMQTMALYLALTGFATKELVDSVSLPLAVILFLTLTALNCTGVYVTRQFRSMAYHSLCRQATLADALKFQKPHHMAWGYYPGIAVVAFSQAASIAILIAKI